MTSREHWDTVYSSKPADQVSWYQEQPQPSLQLIEAATANREASILEVGGGASRLVDALLGQGYRQLTVLDLSGAALEIARSRLGDAAAAVTWVEGDIREVELPEQAYDLWHDRAVFHFLTEPADRQRYVAQVQWALRPGGRMILATFAEDGPTQCSGLPVQRHSPETLQEDFRDLLTLQGHQRQQHTTPWGSEQSFLYTIWQRC